MNALADYRRHCMRPVWVDEARKAHARVLGISCGGEEESPFEVPKVMKLPKLEPGLESSSPFLSIVSKVVGVYFELEDPKEVFEKVKLLVQNLISQENFELLTSANSKSNFVKKLCSMLLHVFPYEFVVFFHFKLMKSILKVEGGEGLAGEKLSLLLSLLFSEKERKSMIEFEEQQLDFRHLKSQKMTEKQYLEFSQKRGTTFLSAGREEFVTFLGVKAFLNIPLKNISWVIEFLSYTLTKICSKFGFLMAKGIKPDNVFEEKIRLIQEFRKSCEGQGDSVYEIASKRFWKDFSNAISDKREWIQLSKSEHNELIAKAKIDEKLLISLVEESNKRRIHSHCEFKEVNYETKLKASLQKEEKTDSLLIFKPFFHKINKRKLAKDKKSKKRIK